MKYLATGLTGALLVGALAAPALAGHDQNPSPQVATYSYDLDEVADNNGGDPIDGTARLKALPNGRSRSRSSLKASPLASRTPSTSTSPSTTMSSSAATVLASTPTPTTTGSSTPSKAHPATVASCSR